MSADNYPFAAMGDPIEILNWRRFDDRLTTSGQPTEAQLVKLTGLGVARIVNLGLHSHEKALADEHRTVAELGMAYSHIPVDFTAPSEDDFIRFGEVLEEGGNDRIHVHCIYNARVTAFLFRYHCDEPTRGHAAALLDSVWRPGSVWARFIGNHVDATLPDRYAGRDY